MNDKLPGLQVFQSLTGLPLGSIVTVQNNKFHLATLKPNINILTSYSPQDSIGIAQNKFVNLGEQIVLNITTGGTANSYKWFKDQIEIIGQTDSKLTISNAALSDAGYYTVKVNNSIINGLSLYTRPTKIAVDNSNLVADSLALVELYNSTGGPNWTNKTNWLNGPVSTWNDLILDIIFICSYFTIIKLNSSLRETF